MPSMMRIDHNVGAVVKALDEVRKQSQEGSVEGLREAGKYILEQALHLVPIETGKQTRLRSGILDINTTQRWELRSADGKKFHTSGNKTKKMALPAGKYQLGSGKSFTLVEIKDLPVKSTNN